MARGNEKGRVERAIRYVRDSFFAARKYTDLDDLNAQATAWCDGVAADRPCPEQHTLTVREAFAEEAPRLLSLPDNPYPLIERVAAESRIDRSRIYVAGFSRGGFFAQLLANLLAGLDRQIAPV